MFSKSSSTAVIIILTLSLFGRSTQAAPITFRGTKVGKSDGILVARHDGGNAFSGAGGQAVGGSSTSTPSLVGPVIPIGSKNGAVGGSTRSGSSFGGKGGVIETHNADGSISKDGGSGGSSYSGNGGISNGGSSVSKRGGKAEFLDYTTLDGHTVSSHKRQVTALNELFAPVELLDGQTSSSPLGTLVGRQIDVDLDDVLLDSGLLNDGEVLEPQSSTQDGSVVGGLLKRSYQSNRRPISPVSNIKSVTSHSATLAPVADNAFLNHLKRSINDHTRDLLSALNLAPLTSSTTPATGLLGLGDADGSLLGLGKLTDGIGAVGSGNGASAGDAGSGDSFGGDGGLSEAAPF